ncbi:unnamed protein product [Lathyrus oleraceus]
MDQLSQNQDALREEVTHVRTQMGQLMEAIQAVAKGQEVMARSQEELRQASLRIAAENPHVPHPVNTPVHIPIGAHPPPKGGPTNQNSVPAINPHILGRVPFDDHHDIFYDALGSPITKMEMKVRVLKDGMKALQGPDTFGLDVTDMCLVPGMEIPPKFKAPSFEKYQGVTCSKTHIRAFCRKMTAHSDDEKLLMHFFRKTLVGLL